MDIKLDPSIRCHASIVSSPDHLSSFFDMKARPLEGEKIRIYDHVWITVDGKTDVEFRDKLRAFLKKFNSSDNGYFKIDPVFKVVEIRHEIGCGADMSLKLELWNE